MKEITSLKQYKAKKHFFNLFIILMQILLFVIFLLIWEISARFKWIDPFLVSSPSAIFNLFISYTQQNILFSHIKISVIETIIGLIIGTLLGFIIATILFLIPTIDNRNNIPVIIKIIFLFSHIFFANFSIFSSTTKDFMTSYNFFRQQNHMIMMLSNKMLILYV